MGDLMSSIRRRIGAARPARQRLRWQLESPSVQQRRRPARTVPTARRTSPTPTHRAPASAGSCPTASTSTWKIASPMGTRSPCTTHDQRVTKSVLWPCRAGRRAAGSDRRNRRSLHPWCRLGRTADRPCSAVDPAGARPAVDGCTRRNAHDHVRRGVGVPKGRAVFDRGEQRHGADDGGAGRRLTLRRSE